MRIFGPKSVSLLKDGKQYRMDATDPRYPRAYKILTNGSADEFISFSTGAFEKQIEKQVDDFIESDGFMKYKHFKIKGALRTKIASLKKNDLSLAPFVNFCEKLLLNPSNNSAEELFDFLEYRELPITEDGDFLAYRGVQSDYWSATGNLETVVLHGEVNSSGQILNKIGATIEVVRNSVDDDRRNECSHGLHAGSLSYAQGHANRVIVVKINPKDAVSVPKDCNFQKLRCCRYEVIADFEKEIMSPSVKVTDKKEIIEDAPQDGISVAEKKIKTYLANKAVAGFESVKVRAVCGVLSPISMPTTQVIGIISNLGYSIKEGNVSL